MPAPRLRSFDYGSRDHVLFVTICADGSSTPFHNDDLCRAVVGSLHWFRDHDELVVYAYCLMPDHLHLLLRLGERASDVQDVMKRFKRFTTHAGWKHGVTGALWQQGFYDHILRGSEDGMAIATYIRHNPVRAGLVEDADAYQWSGYPDPME